MRRPGSLLIVALMATRCSDSPTTPSPAGQAALIGAGDIAECGSPGSEATAKLLDRMPGIVFTAGDNAYPTGSEADYRNCYQPTWGRHRDRTRPTPGNHDYLTPGAAAYFTYFGANAGPPGRGYYSYSAGSWRVISLNSEVSAQTGSAQAEWLRTELTTNPVRCTATYWHRPRFSSGPSGNTPQMQDIWRILYDFNVDIVISAHDHLYERFAPQDPDGRPDAVRGIRQFTVGTGGAVMHAAVAARQNSEVSNSSAWGVLRLTLADGSYQWEFVPVDAAAFSDSGTGQCH
jgi:hypothetical protein